MTGSNSFITSGAICSACFLVVFPVLVLMAAVPFPLVESFVLADRIIGWQGNRCYLSKFNRRRGNAPAGKWLEDQPRRPSSIS